jgi:hypothetical protein
MIARFWISPRTEFEVSLYRIFLLTVDRLIVCLWLMDGLLFSSHSCSSGYGPVWRHKRRFGCSSYWSKEGVGLTHIRNTGYHASRLRSMDSRLPRRHIDRVSSTQCITEMR